MALSGEEIEYQDGYNTGRAAGITEERSRCAKIVAEHVEHIRHYLHMQIGKPIKPELASAPEIALDQLKTALNPES